MSQAAVIRSAIVAAVAGVPEIGQVHAYERYIRGDARFAQLYEYTLPGGAKQLRGWWVRRAATREGTDSFGPGAAAINVHTWHLRGYMALSDDAATEIAFDELIEAIRDRVREDPTFGGVAALSPLSDEENTDGAQLIDSGPVMFCGVLCHSALLEIRTWSYL